MCVYVWLFCEYKNIGISISEFLYSLLSVSVFTKQRIDGLKKLKCQKEASQMSEFACINFFIIQAEYLQVLDEQTEKHLRYRPGLWKLWSLEMYF